MQTEEHRVFEVVRTPFDGTNASSTALDPLAGDGGSARVMG